MRPTSVSNLVIAPRYLNYVGTQSFTQVTIKPHGPIISGSFGLNIGGLDVMSAGATILRYNLGASDLQSSLRAIQGFENVEV